MIINENAPYHNGHFKMSDKIKILLVPICMILIIVSCSTPLTQEERQILISKKLDDPTKSLRITIQSIPPGATIYGVQNGQPGSKLGTTPMTFKFTWFGFRIYGTNADETIIYREQQGSLFRSAEAFLAFKCILIKDRYHPYHINQVIEDRSDYLLGGGFTPLKTFEEGGVKTYSALLKPIASQAPKQLAPATQAAGALLHLESQEKEVKPNQENWTYEIINSDTREKEIEVVGNYSDYIISKYKEGKFPQKGYRIDGWNKGRLSTSTWVTGVKDQDGQMSLIKSRPGLRIKSKPSKREPEQNLLFEDNINVIWRAAKNVRVLSVGVSDFKDYQIPQVKYARSDARNMASFFKSSGIPGENITSLTNEHATRNDITDALIRLKMATTEPYETAIFYFSGHGAPIVKDGKIVDAVLVPYDAMESSLEYTGIRVSMLKEMLSDMRGNSIVILDACFSGKEGRSLMTKNVKAIAVVPKNFNIAAKLGKNTWWLTATSGDNFANDFDKRNSGLFTYYFLKALNGEEGVDANENGLIGMREVFNWTKKEVQAVSAKSLGRLQVPELIGKGDIILTIPK